MPLRTLPAALFALTLIAAGCTGEPAGHDSHKAEAHADHKAEAHADHKAEAPAALALSLNKGAKWSMDEHTRMSSAALQTHLSEATPESVEAMTALGATLQSDLDGLIAGCEMTGPSHDQLHVFLTAFIPQVQALSATTDLDAGHTHVGNLKALMASYGQHFE